MNYRDHYGQVRHQRSATSLSSKATFTLPQDEHLRLKTAALECRFNPYEEKERELFIRSAQDSVATIFGKTTLATIREKLLDGLGVILIQGLPVDDNLPETPLEGGNLPEGFKRTFVSEFTSVVLGRTIRAEPFNFRQEGWGSSPLIDNIVPVQKLKEQRGAGGYKNNFPFHSESAWHRLRPDFLLLNGLRGDPEAQTLVFSVDFLKDDKDLLQDMPGPRQFRLAAPQLYQQMEEEGMPMGTNEYAYRDPIEKNRNGDLILNINFNGTDCRSSEAAAWLQRLEKFIEANSQFVKLDSGQALIANNDLTCHTRSGYTPVFNGRQRWFQRTYFHSGLWDASNRSIRDDDVAETLIAKGWVNTKLELTDTFSVFAKENPDLRKLNEQTKFLAAEAYKLGPSPGCRIV